MAVCLNIRPEYRYRREYMIPVFIGCGKGNIQGATAMTVLQFKEQDAIIVNIVGDLPALKNALGRVGHTAYEGCHLCTDKATRLNNTASFHATKGEPSSLLEEQVVIQGLLDGQPLGQKLSEHKHYSSISVAYLLPYCSITFLGGTIDFMHTACSGVIKFVCFAFTVAH